MWIIIKFDKKKFKFFKNELKNKLSHEHVLYSPKLLIQKNKNNKIINKEYNILGDYIFCYDEKLKNKGILNQLKFVKGLKYILDGFLSTQEEIELFIQKCKKLENKKGYITQNFFQLQLDLKYKFASGPFIDKIFQIINIQQNKIKILVGEIKTTIKKNEFLFNPL
jgi:hypothetical protein